METTIQVATKEMGITSEINGQVNPRLLDYCAKLGVTYTPGLDEVWCALFVGFVLETCGIKSTKSLSARSYLNWGTVEATGKEGDVVVFWRDSVDSPNGHVSFFVRQEGDFIYCLGGNQGSGVVDIEKYPASRVLGYRSAIKTNIENIMENTTPEVNAGETITAETPQVMTVQSVIVAIVQSVEGKEVMGESFPIPVLPEIVAWIQANKVAPGYNITVKAA